MFLFVWFLPQTVMEVKEKLQDGYRMESPENCPPDVYALMKSCWEQEPKLRPSFHKLKDLLLVELNKSESRSES